MENHQHCERSSCDLFTICDTTQDGFSGSKTKMIKKLNYNAKVESSKEDIYCIFIKDNDENPLSRPSKSKWHPPCFMLSITLLQVSCFLYYTFYGSSLEYPKIIDNSLIYDSEKKLQIWRFLTHMLLHFGWSHLISNMLVQLLVGIPLEMIQGTKRIAILYLVSVIGSCIGTSLSDKAAKKLGASGAVYGLIAADLSHIILNFDQMRPSYVMVKLTSIGLIAVVEGAYIIWNKEILPLNYMLYSKYDIHTEKALIIREKVDSLAHLYGALIGLLTGIAIFKTLNEGYHQYKSKIINGSITYYVEYKRFVLNKYLKKGAQTILCALVIFAIAFYTYKSF